MRKLLLASTAVAFGFAGGQAMAAGPLPPTWSQGAAVTAPSGGANASAFDNLSAAGYYTKGALPAPTPGSVVVRFNGRVEFFASVENQTGDTNTVDGGVYKNQPYRTTGYFRFYSGVDGMTTFGLRYGAAAEIRFNPSVTHASPTSGGASGATADRTAYIRRAFAYIGGDWGAIHFGQEDGPVGMLDAGVTTFQGFDEGGLNGDITAYTYNIGVFPFPSGSGNEYTTSKIIYMSPQIAGFDFMASFEPSDTNLNLAGAGAIDIAVPGSQALSSAPGTDAADLFRRRNTYEVGVRYQGAFGPAGIYAIATYMGSGRVLPTSPTIYHTDNLGLFFGGLAVNFAGFRVGGAYMTGAVNNNMALKVDGQTNESSWLVGAQYKMGPMTVGAAYVDDISGGALAADGGPLPSQRHMNAVNVGGTYVVAPGLVAWVSATYAHKHQGGFDFLSGTLGPANNSTEIKVLAIGGQVRW